jgi:hypothetical protein
LAEICTRLALLNSSAFYGANARDSRIFLLGWRNAIVLKAGDGLKLILMNVFLVSQGERRRFRDNMQAYRQLKFASLTQS